MRNKLWLAQIAMLVITSAVSAQTLPDVSLGEFHDGKWPSR